MNEAAIYVIQKYIDVRLGLPLSSWPKYCFEERSYSRWAAYEIQERIMEEMLRLPSHITERESRSPIDVILEFMDSMDSCSEDYKKTAFIFSIAKDTAEDILGLFL
jgi:hypothetical protein